MSALKDKQRDPQRIKPGMGAMFGTIAENAASMSDLIEVILPDFDPTRRWGPCRWQSRNSTLLPQRGDDCLVIFDNDNTPWIVAWWPFG